jgi:membrane-associated phospholipid phosphatase
MSYHQRLSPADTVFIAYLIILSALVLLAVERVEIWLQLLVIHTAAIAFIVALAKIIAPPFGALGAFVRGWYPVAFIPATFKELSYLIPRLHPRDFDWQLAAIDHRMFGVHPTVWMERLLFPPLTEVLQIIYASYYFLPIILGAVLWRKGWMEKFHFWVFVLMFGFYLSYLGYIAVPAIGPRFILAAEQTQPLAGVWFFETIRATLDKAEGITRDCFPSGHTELTILVLYYAYRFHRPTFYWMLGPVLALIFSTVYLRYHYVIDVIAGAALALFVILIAKFIFRVLDGRVLDGRFPGGTSPNPEASL